MIVYHAGSIGSNDNLFFEAGVRNRLFSFAEGDRKLDKLVARYDAAQDKRIFIDSGAFSVFTKGESIDLNRYCEWLLKNKSRLGVYAGLDVIGEWKGSARNIDHMRSRGLDPLPTFHYQSPLEELDRLCRDHDYVALGGLVPLKTDKTELFRWLQLCFGVLRKHWPKKTHALGVTALDVITKFPFYSCDSSSAVQYSAYGIVATFTPQGIKQRSWRNEIREGRSSSMADGIGAKGTAYYTRMVHNINQILKLERHVTDLWTARGIIWK